MGTSGGRVWGPGREPATGTTQQRRRDGCRAKDAVVTGLKPGPGRRRRIQHARWVQP